MLVNVHCKSKDDDLGLHTMSYNQSFKWHFRPNFWLTKLFYYSVTTKNDANFHFDAYVYTRDRRGCGFDCRWLVVVEGGNLVWNRFLPSKEVPILVKAAVYLKSSRSQGISLSGGVR
ncbi:hypothetical protein LguiA_011709 [Lonicera macranthoides]